MRAGAITAAVLSAAALAGAADCAASSLPPAQRSALTAAARSAHLRSQLVAIRIGHSASALQRLRALGLDLAEAPGASGELRAVLRGAAELRALRATGLHVRVLSADLGATDRRDRAADARADGPSALPSGRNTYRTLDEINAELGRLAAGHPGLVRPFELPLPSYEGRRLHGIEITAGAGSPGADARPAIIVDGLTHAREWPTAEVAMEFAHELVDGPHARDAAIRSLLRRVRVVVVPVINTDGYVSSRSFQNVDFADGNPDSPVNTLLEGLPPSGGTLAYRRDTCTGPFPKGTPCVLQTGVDPNRNYSVNWGGDGASSIPLEQDYRGPAPYSETEVQDIRQLSAATNAIVRVSLHTVAAKVLMPPSKADARAVPQDAARLKKLADAITDATGYPNFTGPGLGYDTVGDSNDFGYYAMGELPFVVELGPAEGNFHGPYAESVVAQYTGSGSTTGKGMRVALLRAAAAAADPTAAGRLLLRAPAGTRFQLSRTVRVPTSAKCAAAIGILGLVGFNTPLQCLAPGAVAIIDEPVRMTTTVPRGGRVTWTVPPSTRPFEQIAGTTTAYSARCVTPGGEPRQLADVAIARGQRLSLRCGAAGR